MDQLAYSASLWPDFSYLNAIRYAYIRGEIRFEQFNALLDFAHAHGVIDLAASTECY